MINSLTSQLSVFTRAFDERKNIVPTEKGEWTIAGRWTNFITWLSSKENTRILRIASAFDSFLDKLEQQPVVFDCCEKRLKSQKELYLETFKVANLVENNLKNLSSPHSEKQLSKILQKIVGLKYRIESIHGGVDTLPILALPHYEQVLQCAAQWKLNNPLIMEKGFSQKDVDTIKEVCNYPEFVKILVVDKNLQNDFFNWALREGNDVQPYIEFPNTTKKIKLAELDIRIGYFGGNFFSIQKQFLNETGKAYEKVVTLPFFNGREVKNISVLDEQQRVELNENFVLTIGKVFEIFQAKQIKQGKLEFFGKNGIRNWHAQKLGPWNPRDNEYKSIDLASEDWWQQLPNVNLLTKEEVEKQYKCSLAVGEWIVCPVATASSLALDFDQSHGYLKIIAPREDGLYKVLDFGKFSERMPRRTALDLFYFIMNSVKGAVIYPDCNIYRSDRVQAFFPIVLTNEEGKQVINQLRNEFIKSKEGNLVFQFGGENCAFWVQSVLESTIPYKMKNIYKVNLLASTPSNPVLRNVFSVIRKFPKKYQASLLRAVDLMLGSWRGFAVMENEKLVFKSTSTYPYRKDYEVFQPAYLHQQILAETLPGFIKT